MYSAMSALVKEGCMVKKSVTSRNSGAKIGLAFHLALQHPMVKCME